ncbi:MAG: adenine phosphoribosyltransferase [Nitrospinota bacterium]|nr:adenine phosphoribosyltransferase [Nitrospinota bacterium]
MEELKTVIRDVPDFPKAGILFKDITPVLTDGACFRRVTENLHSRYADKKIDAVVGVEARGFIFGAALACALNAGLVIIRKPGKLPYATYKKPYALEYGTDAVEIHQDAIRSGQRLLIVDDVLATGGTVGAVINLIKENFSAEIVELTFVIELDFLKGRDKLAGLPVHSLVHF